MPVLGVDGCRAGWLGIVLDEGQCEAMFARRVADLVADVGPVEGIGIGESFPVHPDQFSRDGRPIAIWA